jgi:hypothetical protein
MDGSVEGVVSWYGVLLYHRLDRWILRAYTDVVAPNHTQVAIMKHKSLFHLLQDS